MDTMMDKIEAVAWSSDGIMELVDWKDGKVREYAYFGITRDMYDKINRLGRRGQRGLIYKVLKGFSRIDKADMLRDQRKKGIIL